MNIRFCFTIGLPLLTALHLSAATLYVSVSSPNPTPPYATWATAATNIQDAVDAAASGDTVWVTNGIYGFGGRAVGTNQSVNRVAIDKPIQVASVNGPKVTIIQGHQVPGTVTGNGAIRCAYLINGAVLSGFTLRNGATLNSGDFTDDQSGGGVLCRWGGATISDCILASNTAASGGGGVYAGNVNHCIIVGNSAISGGGACYGSLNNCLVVSNSASTDGGGAYLSLITNCTVAFNAAVSTGGGVTHLVETDSIIYYNTAQFGPNFAITRPRDFSGPEFCCTTPVPQFFSLGCLTNEPLFVNAAAGDFHLQAASACINAGTNSDAAGPTDLDGNGRIYGGVVDMGAYEYQFNGPPAIIVQPTDQKGIPGNNITFSVVALGASPLAYQWQFNGTDIPNATDSSLQLNTVTANQAGLYSVVITNALGKITSQPARLALWPDGIAYVWLESPNPTPPYVSWATAAHAVQDAVDAAIPGLVVLATNGTYALGGRAAPGLALTNRVVVDKPLTLKSVNGPQVTVLEGFQVPGTVNGTEATRCLYLTDGATISGFTLTNGASSTSGLFDDRIAGGAWCQSTNSTITNCILIGNSGSAQAGAVYRGTLVDCALTGNLARGDDGTGGSYAGGALMSILIRCALSGNSAGGGFGWGGGASGSTLWECTLRNNSASYAGGGADNSTFYSCEVTSNSAAYGGGASNSQLDNCTVTGNSASGGGGVAGCSVLNSILFYNTSFDANLNYDPNSSLRYSCTTPLPASGAGNISSEPQLASASHLGAGSPCRGAGLAGSPPGTDIDGEAWANPPSMGCDEYHAGAVTGPLSVAIVAGQTTVAAGTEVPFTAVIEGRLNASVWDFGDGVIVSNRPYASHSWAISGDYLVVLRAYHDSQPAGVSATMAIHVAAKVLHYVDAVSTNPVAPFTSWATAAANIQDAADAATLGDEILVGNGVYSKGGRTVGTNALVNRVAVTNLLAVRSLNGPQFTFIQGAQAPGGGNGTGAVRCVYLANGASLSGFTLTNGATGGAGALPGDQAGGGVWCESAGSTLSNCVVIGNSGFYGGGAYRGTLYNCLLNGNSATGYLNGGGGAYQSTLYNCTISGNSATTSAGGGVLSATLYNCIVEDNSSFEANYWACLLNYCCTMPMPTNGVGNITNAPLFVNQAAGDFRLQSDSPCMNAGNNAYVSGTTDLQGKPRISGDTVDMGAYEFQASGPPVVTLDPLNQTVNAGGNVTFTAAAMGALPLFWQWLFNRAAIPSATASSLTLAPVTTNQAGGYSVMVSNSLGSVTSQVAVLTVQGVAPSITQQPLSQTAYIGSNVVFTAAAEGSAPLSWQWQLNGAAMPSATASSLTLPPVTLNAAGSYSVVVTNFLGSVTSQVAVLTVLDAAPTITAQPLSQTVHAGNNATLTVSATGSLPLSWQWRFNGTDIPNATNYNLVLVSVSAGQSGAYSVVVSNALGKVTSADAILTVTFPASLYVWQGSPNPTPPYTNWGTAAHGIQDAVDAAGPYDEIIVTNGIYATGGRTAGGSPLTNRVMLDKPLTLRSVNGPDVTVIQGYQVPETTNGDAAVRCAFVLTNAVLSGFTLTNGATRQVPPIGFASDFEVSGGGAFFAAFRGGLLSHCKLVGNSAAQNGGGVYWGALDNCLVAGNSAGSGGATYLSAVTNCTVTGNSASWGGGTFVGIVYNSIMYYNVATGPNGGDNWVGDKGGLITYCCTTPAPVADAWHNTDIAPLFVDAAKGNFHLQPGSPCINAGNNAFVSGTTDLEGNPRIVGGTVDVGAYEAQQTGSVIPLAWLQQYGLATDGSADFVDSDGDGMNNWQEWVCGTDPTDARSVLRVLSVIPDGNQATVSWQSVPGVSYFLVRSSEMNWPRTNGLGGMSLVATNLVSTAGTNSYVDTNTSGGGPFFYRVGVRGP